MDGVNINKYLGQFNPILIVPVLSAVIGAILVFVFGFRKTSGPKFATGSNTDSLKFRSKKKANGTKQQDAAHQPSTKVQNAQSAKVSKKVSSNETVATKKMAAAAVTEKSVTKKKDEKKTDEKRSENESPTKKMAPAAKKATKESPLAAAATSKKQKSNKKTVADEREQKPADFDDGGWFTIQSKSTKKSNKTDEIGAKSTNENISPKQIASKNKLKSAKVEKIVEQKPLETANVAAETAVTAVIAEPKQQPLEETSGISDVIAVPPADATFVEEEVVAVAAKPASKEIVAQVVAPVDDSNVVFDELGEWTDAKPDRKKGNKKKSRKD